MPSLFQTGPASHLGAQASSPILLDDNFHREIPSSRQGHVTAPSRYYYNNPQRPSLKSDEPGTNQSASIPVGVPIGIDKMSINGITNPQIGGFQCTYPGCSAQPFPTKYLLNSREDVHSSGRPYYCPVEGCPRGRKGFKRKNEMIWHGLVCSSPGYACPYCADREYKYPRPDNLQRSVCCYMYMVINVLILG